MNKHRFTSPLLTLLLIAGAISVYRQSPWLRSPEEAAREQAANRMEGEKASPPPASVRLQMARVMELHEGGILRLARPEAAAKIGLDTERQAAIRKLVRFLEQRTEAIVTTAMRDWKQQGGFQNGRVPSLLSENSPERNHILALKMQTEAQVTAFLRPEEKQKWQEYQILLAQNGTSVSPALLLPSVN